MIEEIEGYKAFLYPQDRDSFEGYCLYFEIPEDKIWQDGIYMRVWVGEGLPPFAR